MNLVGVILPAIIIISRIWLKVEISPFSLTVKRSRVVKRGRMPFIILDNIDSVLYTAL